MEPYCCAGSYFNGGRSSNNRPDCQEVNYPQGKSIAEAEQERLTQTIAPGNQRIQGGENDPIERAKHHMNAKTGYDTDRAPGALVAYKELGDQARHEKNPPH